jgi:hypothetical protein
MVKYYRQGKTSDSSTRDLWKYCHQSSTSKSGKLGKENDELSLNELLLFILVSDFLHAFKSHEMGRWLYFHSEETCAADFYRP